MRKKYPKRHFVLHIAEHVIGVFFVLGVAVWATYLSTGGFARTLPTPPPSGALSATLSSQEGLAPEMTPVFFAVTPAPVTDCSGPQPMTRVLFALSPLSGGTFVVTSNSGTADMKLSWGEYPLPNGTYMWSGMPNPGFVSLDAYEGTFELNGVCGDTTGSISGGGAAASGGGSSNTDGGTSTVPVAETIPLSTSSFVPKVLSRPMLKIFSDNIPVTNATQVFDTENIEFRIGEPNVKKITITAVAKETGKATQIGNAAIDDLLSAKNADIWVYFWSVQKVPDGAYAMSAHVLHTDGTTIDTPPVSITIRHKKMPLAKPEPAEEISDEEKNDTASTSLSATLTEKEEILKRVNEPSACMNELECTTFCESAASGVCSSYARQVVAPRRTSVPSFADGAPSARVSLMLSDPKRRPQELPSVVLTAREFSAYCSELANEEVCTKALVRNDLATLESLAAKKITLRDEAEEQKHILSERAGAREFVDKDMDGVTDYDEVNIYHTDPESQDTDHDGFTDSAEILAHTNPKGNSDAALSAKGENGTVEGSGARANEEVQLEDPLISGVTDSTLLAVSGASVLLAGTNENGNVTVKKLRLSGVSLPNSFVTLFIYSDPITVTVKADASGAWAYTLLRELPDGAHRVISAIADGGGRILAKSEPFSFVKEAAVVSIGAEQPEGNTSRTAFGGASLYGIIAIIIALLGVSFSALGYMEHRKKEETMTHL